MKNIYILTADRIEVPYIHTAVYGTGTGTGTVYRIAIYLVAGTGISTSWTRTEFLPVRKAESAAFNILFTELCRVLCRIYIVNYVV